MNDKISSRDATDGEKIPTPRTDGWVIEVNENEIGCNMVHVDRCEQLERELAHMKRSNDTMFERLAPSVEYVEGTAVGYGEDEIDRLRHDLERAMANHNADISVRSETVTITDDEADFLRRVRDALAPWDGCSPANVAKALDMIGDRLINFGAARSAIAEKPTFAEAIAAGGKINTANITIRRPGVDGSVEGPNWQQRCEWLLRHLEEQDLFRIVPKAADADGMFTLERISEVIDEDLYGPRTLPR